MTEPDGSFELPAPPGPDRLSLVVYAPGWALRIVSVPLDPAGPVVIRVDDVGGRLRFRTAGGPIVPILVHDGVAITMGLLGPAARAEAADEYVETVVERVEPGEYTLCAGFPPAPDRCASGFLHHGGELVLELPR